ncbi:MAG: SDR family oxidoreductase [Desulfamplus sp.]|nr:SDR family oxidoreductase [Desulfamplus sp.]
MALKGKKALVLGAVKGLGKAVGLALAREGVKLALTRHDWPESFASMERDMEKSGADYEIFDIDLLNCSQIESLMEKLQNKFGELHILINNIERGGWPAVHGPYIQDQWDMEMATTLRARRWVFDRALPLLEKADAAAVINFSSIAAIVGRSGPAAPVFNDGYAAASRGASLLTETWARMGAPTIRVNEIMLGIFETRHAQGTRGWEEVLTDDEKKAIMDHIPMGRTGTLDDIVRAVLFILKDAPYMTGSVLRLDGGYVLGGEKVPPMPGGIAL